MGNPTHEELRAAEERMSTKIDAVDKTVQELGKEAVRTDEKVVTMKATQDGLVAADVERKAEVAEVHVLLKQATTSFKLSGDEMKLAREAKTAEDKAKLEAKEAEELAAKNWWKDWKAALTPRNLVAVAIIISAIAAFAQGRSDTAQLLEEVRRAEAIQQGVPPAPSAPAPTPSAAPVVTPAGAAPLPPVQPTREAGGNP